MSIDLPADICEGIAEVQAPFRELDGIRPTDPDQSHVTLKFLGDVEDDQLETVKTALEEAVQAASIGPFTASVDGIGVFPSFDYITVIWLAIETGASPMTALHAELESRFVDLGFDAESHDFRPHVTIARMEHAGAKSAVQELLTSREPHVGEFEVTSLQLKESHLTPAGPDYETIEDVPLS